MNAFLNIADAQMASPVKARHRANDKREAARSPTTRSPNAAEKQLHDQGKLLTQWRKWHREKEEALLGGPFGGEMKLLKSFLRGMAPTAAPELVRMVRDAEWVKHADKETRLDALVMIGRGIVRARERDGLPPFDDSLPGETPTAFEIIREVLR